MSQLFTRKVNYLHVRCSPQGHTPIEKPILLKKRNIPAVGMTLLDAYEPEALKKEVKVMKAESPEGMDCGLATEPSH